jgi:hypothetical protein
MATQGWRLATAIALAMAACWLLAAQAGAYVYWTNSSGGTVGRANLDGTGVDQSFIASASGPEGIAVDSRHVYWANFNTGAIGRSNLDGSDPNQSFITGATFPVGVAVDDEHIYWSNLSLGTISRANLDGSNVIPSFVSGANFPGPLAVDGKYLYWANTGNGDTGTTIGRANLDGTNVDQSFIIGADGPTGVAVDGGHIYWTNQNSQTVGRANLDGTGVNQSFISGARHADGVAVDDQHLFWATNGFDTIARANLDASGLNDSFITGANVPFGVAVDPGPPGTANASAPSIAFGTQALDTLGAAIPLTVTNTGHGGLDIGRVTVIGADPDEFLVSKDACSQSTLAIGASCTIHVRFGPSASGSRSATLSISSDDPTSPLQVSLTGAGGSLPQGPTGPQGAAGPQGPPGRDATVTCKVKGKKKVKCTVAFASAAGVRKARLSRDGVTYAEGKPTSRGGKLVLRFRSPRRLVPGRYTMTVVQHLDGHRVVTKSPVRVR